MRGLRRKQCNPKFEGTNESSSVEAISPKTQYRRRRLHAYSTTKCRWGAKGRSERGASSTPWSRTTRGKINLPSLFVYLFLHGCSCSPACTARVSCGHGRKKIVRPTSWFQVTRRLRTQRNLLCYYSTVKVCIYIISMFHWPPAAVYYNVGQFRTIALSFNVRSSVANGTRTSEPIFSLAFLSHPRRVGALFFSSSKTDRWDGKEPRGRQKIGCCRWTTSLLIQRCLPLPSNEHTRPSTSLASF